MSEHEASVEDEDDEIERLNVAFGDTLYTEDGEAVGIVQGINDGRVILSVRSNAEVTDLERHHRSGQGFGEAELMWRCMNCGEMGEIEDGLPSRCTNCGVEKEELMYWTED